MIQPGVFFSWMEKLPFGSISSIVAPILELHLQIGLLECEYVQEA